MLDQEIIFKKQVHELRRLYARCELFPMKRTFAESNAVGSARFVVDQNFSSGIQQSHLDLRLSIGNSCDDDDDDDVNLSLSIGRSTTRKSKISRKSWKDRMVYTSSRAVIDLEESVGTMSNKEARQNFTVDVAILHQDHLKVEPYKMNSGMHQEWSSFNRGFNSLHDSKDKIVLDLDLNKPQPDESSFHSNEPLGPYPLSDDSYGESCSKISTSSPISKQPKSQTNAKSSQTKICMIDLESLPEPSSDLTEEKEASDYSVEKAALSLISISLQQTSTSSNQDSETKSGSNKIKDIKENKKKTIPRSSSIDSYESLVLKLEESSIEEDSATSRAFELNELDKKVNGIKLRRGRRLKDFQKDILPTLSSLTRHEIWEDINILEGVIRSREYKRLHKAKTSKGENWLTPAKSKRSKVNYVGQKFSSRKRK